MNDSTTLRPFHLLAKPTGAACNLDCSYCFFLSKSQLYPGSRLRMDEAGLEAYIRQLMEAHPGPEVAVAWQGGEPTLMGLPFFRRAVELVAQHRRPGVVIQYTIQTNGTRLDEEWARFFKDNNFLVGLSVDGPRHLHDRHRHARGGGGSFDQVLAGWKALQRHVVDTNILCTVHRDNGDHPLDVYRFFRDEMGARHLQFIPVVERETAETAEQSAAGWGEPRALYVQAGDQAAARSVRPAQYGAFMNAIWDEWVRRDVGTVFVQAFDVALGNRLGRYALCVHAPTCGDALVLEHNGDLYSCDHYVEPDYLVGNIHESPLVDLVASPRQRQFGLAKQDTLPRFCRDCDVLQQCHGGCPKDRFATTLDGEPGLNYLCEGYQAFFRNIAPAVEFMAGALQSGRPPAAVMGEMARRDRDLAASVAAAGRNDTCPCGSGRKVKHCHGAHQQR